MMTIKGVISLCLYHLGDYVFEVTLHKHINYMWYYHMYGQLMLMSHRLDTNNEVWSRTSDQHKPPRHLDETENEQISKI